MCYMFASANNKCSEKFRICESSKADDLRKITTFLWTIYIHEFAI